MNAALVPLILGLLELLAKLMPSLVSIVASTKDIVVAQLNNAALTDEQITQIQANTDALRAMNVGIDKDKFGISDEEVVG